MDTNCGRCGRPVPPDQMESTFDTIVGRMGGPAGSLDDHVRSVASAMQAWRCNRCGRWICNDCILPFVTRSHGRKMRHKTCGGIFLAPDAPGWIGQRGQRAVPTGSWRAGFGIETS